MVITLGPDLEAALTELSRQQGIAPEALALDVLRERFLARPSLPEPRDDWERRLRSIAKDCGVSPPRDAFSREELYD